MARYYVGKGENSIQEVPYEVLSDWAAVLAGSMLAQTVNFSDFPAQDCASTDPPAWLAPTTA